MRHERTPVHHLRTAAIRRRLPATLIAATLLTILPAVATAGATPTPDAPSPELCYAAPRSLEDLTMLLATPESGPLPTRTPGVVPEGAPADDATIAGIEATVRELVACFNAGELLRAYGLYTDDYLRRLLYRQGPPAREAYDALATPEPAPAARRAAILAIRDVRVFDDGTVGATVTIRYARVPMPKTFFFTFVRLDDRWLIDGILGEISFSVP